MLPFLVARIWRDTRPAPQWSGPSFRGRGAASSVGSRIGKRSGNLRQRLLLKGAVGEAGHNDPDDEATVRHGLALLGHLPLGAIVPGNRLPPSALGDGIARLLRRHGRPPARTMTPGSPAAATLAKELGIAYADKLPEGAVTGPRVRAIPAAIHRLPALSSSA